MRHKRIAAAPRNRPRGVRNDSSPREDKSNRISCNRRNTLTLKKSAAGNWLLIATGVLTNTAAARSNHESASAGRLAPRGSVKGRLRLGGALKLKAPSRSCHMYYCTVTGGRFQEGKFEGRVARGEGRDEDTGGARETRKLFFGQSYNRWKRERRANSGQLTPSPGSR